MNAIFTERIDDYHVFRATKNARKAGGYTQASLAATLGVSKGTVAMWETGKRHPSYEKLAEISDLLRVTTDYLIKGTVKSIRF